MDFTPWGWGPMHLVGTIVYGVFSLLALFVAIALIFLLVRYLLVATRAAQLHIAHLEALRAVAPGAGEGAPAAPTATAAAPETPTPTQAPTAPAAPKPATKPRADKTPPAESSGE